MEPTLTVLMPVYNVERFVAEAVQSVLAQTFRDYRLLIIDDGSTDSTLQIVRKLAETDWRITVVSQNNQGTACALNHGLKLAGTEWVALMHGDDVMMPNRLERQVAFIAEHPNLTVASSLVHFIDSAGRSLGPNRSHLTSRADVRSMVNRNECIAFSHPAVILRREAILKAGGYRQEYWPAEDVDLWNRLVAGGHDILVQPESLLNYRIHGGSASARRANLVIRKLRWIELCMAERRSGRPELTWDQFESRQRGLPMLARLNEFRMDLARTWYQFAQHLYADRRYLSLMPRVLGAVILEPKLFLPRLVSRFWPNANSDAELKESIQQQNDRLPAHRLSPKAAIR